MMRTRIMVALLFAVATAACLDVRLADPCARFADREVPASCRDGGTITPGTDGGNPDGGGPDSGTPVTCSALQLETADAGDLLQDCTGNDGGQGSCASPDEVCTMIGPLTRCVKYCGSDPDVCPKGTVCKSADSSQAYLPGICVPVCNARLPGAGCPQAFVCAPSSPDLDDPGFCVPHCTVNGCSGTATCGTDGVCHCKTDSCGADPYDPTATLVCDPTSRVCYRPCSSGCGDACCDDRVTGSTPFCRFSQGPKKLCEPCARNTDCATGFCDPVDSLCNTSTNECVGTGICEHFGLQCTNQTYCACPH